MFTWDEITCALDHFKSFAKRKSMPVLFNEGSSNIAAIIKAKTVEEFERKIVLAVIEDDCCESVEKGKFTFNKYDFTFTLECETKSEGETKTDQRTYSVHFTGVY